MRPSDPTLILVDDLQWVDELSFALLHYLVRAAEAGGPPLALVVFAGPSENATSPAASFGRVLPAERSAGARSTAWSSVIARGQLA